MKRVILLSMIMTVFFTACNQREQQKKPSGQHAAPVITAEDIRQLQGAAKMSPQDPNAWILLGNAFMDTSQFNEAVDAYQKALSLTPKNVDVRVDLGTCYRSLGKPDKALEEYRKALAINPDHLNARRNSGVVLAFDLKKNTQAIKEFEKYLQLAPNAPDALQIRQLIQDLKTGK